MPSCQINRFVFAAKPFQHVGATLSFQSLNGDDNLLTFPCFRKVYNKYQNIWNPTSMYAIVWWGKLLIQLMILRLFNDKLSTTQTIPFSGRIILKDEMEITWKRSWTMLSYYSSTYVEEMRKVTKELGPKIRSPGLMITAQRLLLLDFNQCCCRVDAEPLEPICWIQNNG
jgi:hypothetical protein